MPSTAAALTPDNPPSGRLLTISEVAVRGLVSEYTVQRWIRDRDLAHVRLSRNMIRVREEDLDAFLEARFQGADPKPRRKPGRPKATDQQ